MVAGMWDAGENDPQSALEEPVVDDGRRCRTRPTSETLRPQKPQGNSAPTRGCALSGGRVTLPGPTVSHGVPQLLSENVLHPRHHFQLTVEHLQPGLVGGLPLLPGRLPVERELAQGLLQGN